MQAAGAAAGDPSSAPPRRRFTADDLLRDAQHISRLLYLRAFPHLLHLRLHAALAVYRLRKGLQAVQHAARVLAAPFLHAHHHTVLLAAALVLAWVLLARAARACARAAAAACRLRRSKVKHC